MEGCLVWFLWRCISNFPNLGNKFTMLEYYSKYIFHRDFLFVFIYFQRCCLPEWTAHKHRWLSIIMNAIN